MQDSGLTVSLNQIGIECPIHARRRRFEIEECVREDTTQLIAQRQRGAQHIFHGPSELRCDRSGEGLHQRHELLDRSHLQARERLGDVAGNNQLCADYLCAEVGARRVLAPGWLYS